MGSRRDRAGDSRLRCVAGQLKFVVRLQIQPPLGLGAEIAREPQGPVGGNGSLAADDLADAQRWNSEGLGERLLRESQRLQEILGEDFARMDRGDLGGLHDANLNR